LPRLKYVKKKGVRGGGAEDEKEKIAKIPSGMSLMTNLPLLQVLGTKRGE